MQFHEKLRLLCGEQRLSQKQLASRLKEASKYTINRWFLGGEPSLSQAAKLSQLLGVSLEYLANDDAAYPPDLNDRANGHSRSAENLSDVPDIRMIVSAIGREEALDRLLLRRREAVAGQAI